MDSSIGRALDCESGDPGLIPRTAQVTSVLIDHEILSTVIRTVRLLRYVQKLSVPCKSEGN
jgi:hypothetical protein